MLASTIPIDANLGERSSYPSFPPPAQLQPEVAPLEREYKYGFYVSVEYEAVLARTGSFMMMPGPEERLRHEGADMCQSMLRTPWLNYENFGFLREDGFKTICQMVENQNEAMVFRDITPLLVPSVQHLQLVYNVQNLKYLSESVAQVWNGSCPIFFGLPPQPDYSVGFAASAFTAEQLAKFEPFSNSPFVATRQMYFPFLTCEVCSDLDIADRQNAHSMTLAVRGIVELYRLAGRERELDRVVLGFSVSHNHQMVRLYAHYAVIGGRTKYWRYLVKEFDFTVLDGMEKWMAFGFTQGVYKAWVPVHLERISRVLDQLRSVPAGHFEAMG